MKARMKKAQVKAIQIMKEINNNIFKRIFLYQYQYIAYKYMTKIN